MNPATPSRPRHRDTRALLCAWVVGLAIPMAALGAGPARAAPPAGTPIDNTATASGRDSVGAPLQATSNTVTAIVQVRDAVTLAPDRGGFAQPGAGVTLAHVLVNTGNVVTDFRLDAANLAGDDFDVATFGLVHDRNRDGVVDAGDTPIANGGVLTLAAGDSANLLLTATVPANAPGLSQALFSLTASDLALPVSAAVTDTVHTGAVLAPPALAFYAAADYATRVHATALGAPLFVQASAPQCDRDPANPDTVQITLQSLLTGDLETYAAIESGANTGVFRITGAPVSSAPPVLAGSSDGVLQQARGDQITALLPGCGATETRDMVWVEPGGTVFDAASNAPVAGAHVQLVDVTGAGNGGVPGGLASVWQLDGVTPAPADVVTDAQGGFEFPVVPASTYRLVVTPPAPWRFPSRMPFAGLPANRVLDAAGSYGGPFALALDRGPIVLDVPVDDASPVVLFAEKSASRPVVEWGDELDYRVRIANRSDSLLDAVRVDDALPAGFSFVPGSARRDGSVIAGPAGAGGGLDFALGPLAPRAETELAYRVRVGPGTPQGAATNTAIARAGANTSNTATVTVRVQGDAFADDGLIAGTVFFDAGRDRRADPGDPGMAGVRLYLDDGTFAVTDERGRYSFAGLTPRTHVLKLDATSLPPSAKLESLDHRQGDTPSLRFVDLTRGDLVRADFAVVGDTALMREAGDRRIAIAAHRADEGARALARPLDALNGSRASGDPRALPPSRVVTGEDSPAALETRTGGVDATPAVAPGPGPGIVPAEAIDQLLPGLDPDLGFVGLADLDTLAGHQIAVVVKGPLGTRLALRVNGAVVPESRVGRRFTAAREGIEAWEYVGVALRPGLNVLEVAPPRSIGRVALRLIAPGPFAKLELSAPRSVPADGHSAASLSLRATDAAGVPVGERTLVTLDAGAGRLAARDLDAATPGVQVAVEAGVARVALIAPATPGTVKVQAAAGNVRAAVLVEFVPDLRPLIAVGAAEGVVSLNGFRRHGAAATAMSASPAAAFEAPMTQFTNQSRDGTAAASAHGALFVKGRVRDNLLLTMGWDSDRPRDQRQFRDQQPDRGFPLFGDAGARGWEAQSTGQLYARIEQKDASLLYGDFVTGGTGARTLGNYSRSLTGAAAHWERAGAQVNAFTSRDHSQRAVDELRGLGTSGPYVLTHLPMIVNSERVEILVRDRAQPSLVLSSTVKQRFTDYELEPITGRLLFRAPVPSVDAQLNLVSVRVSYEVAGDGAPAWVHGFDGRVRVNSRLELGGVLVDDHDPAAPFELRGASAAFRLGVRTVLETEWAGTRRVNGLAGDATRLELRHDSERVQARVYGVATATGFDNPGAGFGGGRSEAGAHLTARLADRTRLSAEALFSADALGREKRGGLLVSVDRALSDALRGELGMRVARGTTRGLASEPASAAVRAKLTAQLPRHPEWSGYGELEQDTREFDRRMAALGGEYRFAARGRLYARHELLSSHSSPWALSAAQQQSASVLGVDADLAKDAHLFTEYRLSDAFAGREAQAAVGLRNGWQIANGLRVGTSFERVSPLSGSPAGATTALTGSVDWADDATWKGSSRVEVRTSRASDQFLQSMAAAVKLDSAWTGLGRHLLTLTDQHGHGGDARERLQLGFAYRTGSAWDALGRWEFRYDREIPAGESSHRHIANIAGIATTGRTRGWESSIAWAGKLTRDQDPAFVTAGGAQWLHGRLTRDLASDWDAGLSLGVLTGRHVTQRQYGAGAELGRMLPGGTWVSLGYNRFGYADDELAGDEWTRQGAYLRLRVKLDESLLQHSREVRR